MFTLPNPPVIVAVLAAVALLMFLVGLMGYLGEARRVARMHNRVAGPGAGASSGLGMLASIFIRKSADMFRGLGSKVTEKDSGRRLGDRTRLARAGIRGPSAHLAFQGVKVVLALGLGLAAFAGVALWGRDFSLGLQLLLTAMAAALGAYLPDFWLNRRTTKRKFSIMRELPDALDLLVVCVESGMGLDQAISRVSRELARSCPNISRELNLLTLELRAGMGRQKALRGLANRVDLDDVSSLVTLLIQADAFGISVGRTLRVYADTMRTKRFQLAEEKAAKLPAKLLFPLVICILPALFAVIMGPAVLQMMGVFSGMK